MSEETTPEIESKSEESKPKQRRLREMEWRQVVNLWEGGLASLSDLVERYGISKQALQRGLKKRGAVKNRRAAELGEDAFQAAKTENQKLVEEIGAFKRRFIGYGDVIAKLTMKEVQDALKDGLPMAAKKDNLHSLQRAANILGKVRDEGYHLMGLYDEDTVTEDLPDIAMAEYSAEELEEMERQFEEVQRQLNGGSSDDDGPDLPFGDDEDED